ncbi:MAG: molecular chaperone TorD family protein [Pseudomonadota bacterium]
MVEELKAELLVLNLLRQVFLKEPGRDLLEGIGQIVFSPDEEGETGNLRRMLDSIHRNKARIGEWVDELSLEFARLFIGPIHPPAVPFASFYLSESRSLMSEETLEVRKRYLKAGLALKDLHQIPDDHIAMELEFLYYLTREAIQSLEERRNEEASGFLTMRNDFMRDHMALWVPFFIEKIINFSNEDFYQGAALMLREFIDAYGRTP